MGNLGCGCPGSRAQVIERPAGPAAAGQPAVSHLRQWPVQLHLLPPTAAYFQNAPILVCADCVAFAMGDMHQQLLQGRALAIACPKLDQTDSYEDKLAAIFAGNATPAVTVAIMEVPCCRGLDALVRGAVRKSGRDIPVETVIVGIDGTRRN